MKSLRFLVRLDDITPYMDRERFDKVRSVLDKYGICPMIGMVPDCRDKSIYGNDGSSYSDEEYRALINELTSSGWIVAMHGTNHVYSTEDAGLLGINPFSEFAGTSYEVQYTKLKQGRDILHRLGIETDLFMAPGHSFDENTLKALKDLGFRAITDGLYHKPYLRESILFIPCTLVAYDKMHGLDTICLHTNNMTDKDISDLEKFISRHKGAAIRYNEDDLRVAAVNYSETVAMAESAALKMRSQKDRIANSPKLGAFLADTDHPNTVIKWLKRLALSPVLLTRKYGKQ